MQLKQLYIVLILTLIVGVNGCGFKLRGTAEPLPAEIRQLTLTGIGKGGDFYTKLSHALIGAGAELSPPKSLEKHATLTIHNIEQVRDEVSDSGGQTLYRSSVMVTFSLSRGEETKLINSRRLRASREFSFDSNNPYGLEQQDKLINNELQRDLIRQLIRQVRAAGSIKRSDKEIAR